MLEVLTFEQRDRWDSLVRSFKKYDAYWLNGYVKAFQIHGDGDPLLFSYESEKTRGINVVMKRDVAKDRRFAGILEEGKYFDFTTPYGYGGWLIEGEETEGLFDAYQDWCERNGIISEFVRFHPMVKNHEKASCFYEIIQLGKVVHMNLESQETIWSNLTGSNRRHIRKAIKDGVKIYNGRYPEIYATFRKIYNSTMEKVDAENYYYFEPEFYTSVLNDLPQNAQVFYAVKDGIVIAASIILATNGMMNYHLSGSMREYSSLAATNLLLYTVALWGTANSYKSLYLGGGVGSEEDSLFQFKRSFFKGELNQFFIGKKIYNQEKYDELMGIRNVSEGPFFPRYRA
ncbi:GNAT family N-acetyltransferase [uncultured Dysosmobacter sp.]|uniref:GNAT family N-acetyltransferase n=1 Tax=uncultured Dysosmobacter sp. TaxID=2591384 RepID=UPI002626E254|nr:GNAT family N-acetyltransferase [uncultured Dysosmobacter sp.]